MEFLNPSCKWESKGWSWCWSPKYLTDEEEDEVVRWLEGCAIVGCAKSIREVRVVVGAIVAKKLGMECTSVSHGWWDRF